MYKMNIKKDLQINSEKKISYYEETQVRSVVQSVIKFKNTLLLLLAYACPNNKLRIQFHRWRGVTIGKKVYLGMFCFLDNLYPDYIYIEDFASVNAGTMILTHFNPMKRFAPIIEARVAPVVIHQGAIIAVRSIILPGVQIGSHSIVAAGSVVDKDVTEYTLVQGNPAKKVTEYFNLMNNNIRN